MDTEQLKAFITEHYPSSKVEKIEWIDDSSANVPFSSEYIAQEALVALVSVEIADVTQLPVLELLPAKKFSKRPELNLEVRLAVAGDKKQAGAAQRSRFYLLHPEYDPDNRKRNPNPKRYRDRDDEGNRRRPHRISREDEPIDRFDVNLYDDDAAALATRPTDSRPRRRRSYTPEHGSDDDQRRTSYRNANRSKELFPEHSSGRNSARRDRSASPARDRDGDLGMDNTASDGSAERNRRGARAIKDRLTRSNQAKELFPDKTVGSGSDRLEDTDEASSYLSSRFTLPLYDGSNDEPPPRSLKLEDRITVPGRGGRLADRITNPAETSGFNIRGAARQRSADQGFAIKGVANKSAKELFPEKFGSNAGKELFADRLDGRSRPRQKAGDLFD
jgi:hypothetical protein